MSNCGMKLRLRSNCINPIFTKVGIKPNPRKVKGITDLGITTTTTKAQAPLGMVQCYGDTWKRGLYALALMVGVSIETKDFKNLQ